MSITYKKCNIIGIKPQDSSSIPSLLSSSLQIFLHLTYKSTNTSHTSHSNHLLQLLLVLISINTCKHTNISAGSHSSSSIIHILLQPSIQIFVQRT